MPGSRAGWPTDMRIHNRAAWMQTTGRPLLGYWHPSAARMLRVAAVSGHRSRLLYAAAV